MTNISGTLHKMRTELQNPVRYHFNLKNQSVTAETSLLVNEYLGKNLRLQFTGQINCINCNRAIKKTFSQGYCFPCSQKLAACDMCILKPQLCHFHLGTCREPEWGLA